ncbi:SH3 domain-binding glutamic acid-rich-like protein 3 [Oopsacas minuta]|uniref:SH3 domain-binding glutamic acid-rich-like protein 3 n=1 Tax=Oopsacas minuta TaxID=111878 RepID=A0AAV7JJK4_9METZ|nr:SH3 domain-binding glutamic acid-rich-like protein 3 [Oopsacas minuta]
MAVPIETTTPSLTLYFSSVLSNLEIKKQQQKIDCPLLSRTKMRELAGNDKALPPQICNGDEYCGDFIAFEDAIESAELKSFLKLE